MIRAIATRGASAAVAVAESVPSSLRRAGGRWRVRPCVRLASTGGVGSGSGSDGNGSDGGVVGEKGGRRPRRSPLLRSLPDDGVSLSDFVSSSSSGGVVGVAGGGIGSGFLDSAPWPSDLDLGAPNRRRQPRKLKFHLRTYGCQMNSNDSDVVRSILLHHGSSAAASDDGDDDGVGGAGATDVSFEETFEEMDADVLLTNTCAIRENAESKVWQRLRELRAWDAKDPLDSRRDAGGGGATNGKSRRKRRRKRVIGVLGCMAERLKDEMFRDGTADLVVGPDAYRDLPRLVSLLVPPSDDDDSIDEGPKAVERASNTQLSLDETYAEINPVRSDPDDVCAYVSVMRGCNNMCSFCVVPFTRGRERSRELSSVVDECRRLVETEGVKEICLLGQNVNSYHDKSPSAVLAKPVVASTTTATTANKTAGYSTSNSGFGNLFKLRGGAGYYFADLVDAVSSIDPELRVRFTSPHPKDYPPELLTLMSERTNVCSHLHMPAQSGSTSVLRRMRRGYTRDAYLRLVNDARAVIPGVSISTDVIAGFCGETESEHRDTVTLMEEVGFDLAYMFAYSMRERTHAHRTMVDDVPADVKKRRLHEIIDVFRRRVQEKNDMEEVGRIRLVLTEGESRRSNEDDVTWTGRTDGNKRVVFGSAGGDGNRNGDVWDGSGVERLLATAKSGYPTDTNDRLEGGTRVTLRPGDYVAVEISEARGHTLRGRALWRTTLTEFHRMGVGGGVVASNLMRTDLVSPEEVSRLARTLLR